MIAARDQTRQFCRLSKSVSVSVPCRVLPPLLTTMQPDEAEARLKKRQLEQKINLLDRLGTRTKTGVNHRSRRLLKFKRRFVSDRPQHQDGISLLKGDLPIGLCDRETHFNAGVP